MVYFLSGLSDLHSCNVTDSIPKIPIKLRKWEFWGSNIQSLMEKIYKYSFHWCLVIQMPIFLISCL